MTSPQILWGLSNGVIVLAIAGMFWLGVGLGRSAADAGLLALVILVTIQVGSCAGLIRAAVRLRRRSGFTAADLRRGNERERAESRRIQSGFRWIGIVQAILVGGSVFLCIRLRREDLIGPAIGFVVSLHFAPLGRIFHVRAYYLTALCGTLVSVVAVAVRSDPWRLAFLGSGLAVVMWLSAGYIVRNAAKIAVGAVTEPWAV